MKKAKNTSVNIFFSNGHLNEEGTAIYAEALTNGMFESVPEEIFVHVEQCHQCKKEVFAVHQEILTNKTINAIIYEEDTDLTRANKIFMGGKYTFILKVAVSILLFLGIVGIIYYVFYEGKKTTVSDDLTLPVFDSTESAYGIAKIDQDNNIPQKQIIPVVKTDSSNSNQELLAINMTESSFFESLISTNLRDQEAFEVTKPTLGQHYIMGQKIEFNFKGDLSVPIELSIYKNNDKRIFRDDSITNTKFYFQNKLDKGLYYWKVRRNKELISVGKFFVK